MNIHQSKGFRESNLLLRICRNSYLPSVLSCACTPMSYTLTSKSFTLSRKKSDDRHVAYLTFWTTLSFQKRRAKQGNWLRQGLTKTKPSVSFFVVAILYAHRRDLIHAKRVVSVLSPLASKSSGRSHTRKEICYEIKMMQFCCTLSHKWNEILVTALVPVWGHFRVLIKPRKPWLLTPILFIFLNNIFNNNF